MLKIARWLLDLPRALLSPLVPDFLKLPPNSRCAVCGHVGVDHHMRNAFRVWYSICDACAARDTNDKLARHDFEALPTR